LGAREGLSADGTRVFFETEESLGSAATDAQRRLLPELKVFRVRMALYTGEAEAHLSPNRST